MAAKKKRAKPGPEADRLKIEGDWKDAVRKAISKKRPETGWPGPSRSRDRRPRQEPER